MYLAFLYYTPRFTYFHAAACVVPIMRADATVPCISLSPAYRHAQRVTARWLDGGDNARRTRFALRTAWAALDAMDHDRLVRWLAWLCVAAASHGDTALGARLQRVDAIWGLAITRAMGKLPGARAAPVRHRALRLSA